MRSNLLLLSLCSPFVITPVAVAGPMPESGLEVCPVGPDQAPLPDAVIGVTDAQGSLVESGALRLGCVRFGVAPGTYRVDVAYPGKMKSRVRVEVAAGPMTSIVVEVKDIVPLVYVEKAMDTSSATRGRVITKEFLQRVPSGRNYQPGAVQQAAGVGVGALGGGNPSIGGGAAWSYAPTPRTSRPAAVLAKEVVATGRNPVTLTKHDDLSTFAIDVDTASYALNRRILQGGYALQPDSVRTEEFVNAFRYEYAAPEPGLPFQMHIAGAPHPDDDDLHLLRVGLQSAEADGDRVPLHLTLLVDVSGSMQSMDKLPLAIDALQHMVDGLTDEDTVAIVTYAGRTGVVLSPTSATDSNRIKRALETLRSGGGTAMASGMELAYGLADDAFVEGHENRVVVLSDGDANIGPSGVDGILETIAGFAGRGISMTTLGFGTGNYRDGMMEQLSNRGDGNHFYIDSMREARRVLGENLTMNTETLARDVKIQVGFDAKQVASYRLLGYENRDVADEDFDNDSVDAGELGTGHQVTALYELTLTGRSSREPMVTVSARAKRPGPDQPSEVFEFAFDRAELSSSFAALDPSAQRAFAVAGFAEALRESGRNLSAVKERVERLWTGTESGDELLALVDLYQERLQEERSSSRRW